MDEWILNRLIFRCPVSMSSHYWWCVACPGAGGEDTLARIQAERVDLMLVEVEMPEVDGLSILRALRQSQDKGDGAPFQLRTSVISSVLWLHRDREMDVGLGIGGSPKVPCVYCCFMLLLVFLLLLHDDCWWWWCCCCCCCCCCVVAVVLVCACSAPLHSDVWRGGARHSSAVFPAGGRRLLAKTHL